VIAQSSSSSSRGLRGSQGMSREKATADWSTLNCQTWPRAVHVRPMATDLFDSGQRSAHDPAWEGELPVIHEIPLGDDVASQFEGELDTPQSGAEVRPTDDVSRCTEVSWSPKRSWRPLGSVRSRTLGSPALLHAGSPAVGDVMELRLGELNSCSWNSQGSAAMDLCEVNTASWNSYCSRDLRAPHGDTWRPPTFHDLADRFRSLSQDQPEESNPTNAVARGSDTSDPRRCEQSEGKTLDGSPVEVGAPSIPDAGQSHTPDENILVSVPAARLQEVLALLAKGSTAEV
jgi:hypothetical protein